MPTVSEVINQHLSRIDAQIVGDEYAPLEQSIENRGKALAALGTSGGGGGGITQADVTAAIQASADIDTIITRLSAIEARLQSGYRAAATITRAANTAEYIANDVYGSTFELANFGAANSHSIITSVNLLFEIAALPVGMGGFSLYLYDSAPSEISDNAAFSIPAGDRDKIITPDGIYLGVSKLAVGGGLVVLQAPDINRQIPVGASGSVWGRLITLSAFTPATASETATISALTIGV